MNQPRGLRLREARTLLSKGTISVSELIEEHLARAKRTSELNAFITIDEDGARLAARDAEQTLRDSGPEAFRDKPLLGMPITAKDIFASRGLLTTSGSRIYSDHVPDADATALARLRAAGAILVGKTNLHEFAYGVSNVNPHYGPARNPWAHSCISGGSSGGSAVALAMGAGLGSLGSDTGGSIRIPSALCGTVGLKPTYGRVSRHGVTPLSWSLDHVGPMGGTVEDTALLYDVMAGADPADPSSLRSAQASTFADIAKPPADKRIGLHRRYFFENLAPEVDGAVRTSLQTLESMGFEIVEVDVPEIELQTTCRNLIAFAEASSYHEANVRSRPNDYGEDTRMLLRLGLLVPASDYLAALRTRGVIVDAFVRLFEKIDFLVSPTTPAAASPIGEGALDNGEELRSGLLRLASPFNTTGFPAVSLPCSFTSDGRPIGLQLAAAPLQESRLLGLAYAFEQAHRVDWPKPARDTL
jgi:aspartyl-tRNA(Asn)/glutamyl-tRNA(Gln) amidotransferase subunit A